MAIPQQLRTKGAVCQRTLDRIPQPSLREIVCLCPAGHTGRDCTNFLDAAETNVLDQRALANEAYDAASGSIERRLGRCLKGSLAGWTIVVSKQVAASCR